MTGEQALRGGRIHFVCARNVCRSPAMALAFIQLFLWLVRLSEGQGMEPPETTG